MELAVRQLDKQFDAKQLYTELLTLKEEVGHTKTLQFILTHHADPKGDAWVYGAGSLYDDAKKKYWARTADFSKLTARLEGTYTSQVIDEVREIALSQGKKIGRVRILTLEPKTCYSLHTDDEEFRYHIPLFTSGSSFFIADDIIDRMPVTGQLYQFRTNEAHTAVNAHKTEQRSHLVFDTYE